MNRKRPHFASFGPPIPIVSVKEFTRRRFSEEEWAKLWSLCGPTADRALNGRCPLALWKVICLAYFEGLDHGSGTALAMVREKKVDVAPGEDASYRGIAEIAGG